MKKFLVKELNYFSRVIVVGMVLGISIHFAAAWQEPTQNPPGGNLGAPINTSAIPQTKNGGLTLKGGYLGLDSDLINGKFAYINQTSNSGNLLYSVGLNRSSVQGTSAPDIYGSNGSLVLGGDMNGAGNIYLQADGIKNCSGSLQTDANGKVVCGGSGGGWQGTVSEAYSVFDFSEDGWGAVGGKACGPEDIAGNPFNYDGDSTLRSNEESRNMGLHKVCFLTAVNPGKDSPETGTCKVEKIGNNWYLKATDNKIVNTTSICGEIKEKGLEKTIERWAMLCEAVCLD